MKTHTQARLHEHAGQIAIRIGDNQTIYITPILALELATALKEAGTQIKNGYHYATTEIGE